MTKGPDNPPPPKRAPRTRYRENPARLAEKLLRIRCHFNLTQIEMLNIVNPPAVDSQRARISLYEYGRRVPSILELYHYAKFAKVPMEDLVNDDADLPF